MMDIDVEEDNVLIPLRLRGTRILTPDRQSLYTIFSSRSSPFSCTVVNIPTWIDSIISPIFSLSATFDFISPDRIREQDWIPRRGLCPHAFNITIRGSD
jgi:hypothetical protein